MPTQTAGQDDARPGDEASSQRDRETWEREYGALCQHLQKLRKEAIDGRASSGIEQIWLEDEEQYEGIDNVNRAERALKATSPDGSIRLQQEPEKAQTRSTVFVEITRPYVDAAAARIGDMLLPTDDRNYLIEPTPIPDLVQKVADQTPIKGPNGESVVKPVLDEQGNQEFEPGSVLDANGAPVMQPKHAPYTVGDEAARVMAVAKACAEKAQKQIDDWLTECSYLDECRTMIDDAARIGPGILKGPTVRKLRKRAVVKALEGIGIVIKESMAPVSVRVDPWNFYPDPACGEDIQRGKFTFEKDDITGRMLEMLKGGDGYDDEAINAVLDEGPMRARTGTLLRGEAAKNDAEMYEIWYFHGYLSAGDLDVMGTQRGEGEQFPVVATMVNDKIIKVALAVLDTGEFPYDVMVWQRRAGSWAGKGVARQMRTEQRGVNAAVRNLMDNAGLSGGPQVIINRAKIEPANGVWEITPRKVWLTRDGEEVTNVRDAIVFVNIQSLQAELMAIIDFWLKRAEDVTGLPMLLQGQLGGAPDTVGGMTMLNNNATAVLRRIARYFDTRVTARHIGRYYEFLLIYGEDNSAKGDFTVKARGSSALIERDSQSQLLMQMMGLSKDPAYKLDPKKIMQQVLKAQRIPIDDVEMSDDDYAKAQQGAGQSPQVAVAQLREQGANQRLQAELQDRDKERQIDAALRQWEKQVDAMLEQAQMDTDKQNNLDGIKAQMAGLTLKLKTQIGLAGQQRTRQSLTPAVEPPQRAPAGQSFAQ